MFEIFEKNPKRKIYAGIIFALLAAIFVGSVNVVGKLLVTSEHSDIPLSPFNVVLFSSLIVALMFTPSARKKEPIKSLGLKIIILIVLMGIIDTAAILLNFSGLEHTSAINASIIGDTEIMFTMLIAITIFRERISKKEFLPLVMILTGSMLIPFGMNLYQSGLNFSAPILGDILIISAALLYAVDIGISKYVTKKASPERMSQIAALAGFPFALLLIVLFQIPFDVTLSHLPYIFYFGIFIVGLSYYFFIIALRLIGIVKTVVIYSSVSTFGIVFSNVFLGEIISWFNILSILFVIIGVYMLRKLILKIET